MTDMEAADRAADFVESKGYKVSRGIDSDSNFGFQGIFIEIHSRIVEQHNYFTRKFLRKLEEEVISWAWELSVGPFIRPRK